MLCMSPSSLKLVCAPSQLEKRRSIEERVDRVRGRRFERGSLISAEAMAMVQCKF